MKSDFTRWLPAIAKTTADRLPTIVKNAASRLPGAVKSTTEQLPGIVKSTTERLPAIVKNAADQLPEIARTADRKAVLGIAGVAALGGLALGPTAIAAPVTAAPHAGAVAAIGLATGTTDESGLTTSADSDTASGKASTDRPTRKELIPYGVQGAQSRVPLDNAQIGNAKAIIKAAKATGVGERGAVIGVATSLQESKLYNLGHLGAYNDHDSEGLFQQRPSSGWGTSEQITDPDYASKAFFNALKNVGGWRNLPLTTAAQKVQVSAYPFAYAQWEEQAADVVQQLW